jgi:hypothetical protein
MAYDNNQEEFPLPVNNQTDEKRNSSALLPRFFRTPTNNKFLYSTLDQFLSPGTVEKISAFYGRKISKAFTPQDNYINEVSNDRQNYQLEPVVIKKDSLGNVIFYKDYVDYINQIKTLGGNTDNHNLLNSAEYYGWNPHIDWDKFVNFREYYWQPSGPTAITITGAQEQTQSTYTVELADNLDNYAYLLTPDGLTQNATIKLYKGVTYKFNVNTPGLPFTIKTARTLNSANLYNEGVDQQSIEQGVITFEVRNTTPDVLYYVSSNDINAYGLIQILDLEENSAIDVEKEIIGKKTFTLSNGLSLSNGMKVNFKGNVTPAEYAENDWYVEGVGDAIVLVNEQNLSVPNDLADENLESFDGLGFDGNTFDIEDTTIDSKDYIVIKRSSPDLNPWSKANKWVHKSVLQAVANYNGSLFDIDEAQRAKRPIIEFDSGLKLYKFGSQAKPYVDVVDTFTKDVFSDIEGATGYNVDGVDLVDGMRLLVTADPDTLVKNRIFTVKIINFGGDGDPTNKQISLIEPTDSLPLENEVVQVTNGVINQGKMFYYDGASWKEAQAKTTANQAPLFDLCDENGNSFSNEQTYPSTNFLGNKIFSYKIGTGSNDTELGFPLSYRNVNNVGDIVFDFNLLSESFTYQLDETLVVKATDIGYLKNYSNRTTYTNETGWKKASAFSKQMVLRQYLGTEQTNDFAVDVYDKSGNLLDIKLKIFVNNILQTKNEDYELVTIDQVIYVRLNKELEKTDSITIKSHSAAAKNDKGHYEMAINLESNPFNSNLNNFTFGEVANHLESIVEQLDEFTGSNPGSNNLRDISDLCIYGTKFVQHSAPLNLAVFHLSQKEANVVKALGYAQKEYDKFKKTFLQVAENSGFQGSTREQVDQILKVVNKDKNNDSFYFSDMVPYGAAKKLTFNVLDDSNVYFALSQNFSMTQLSTKAVQVYLNGEQLLHKQDYIFNNENFCEITKALAVDDLVEIFEYENTNGNYVPPTPTKLGLYPRFNPSIYEDTTLITTRNVIQGHDGSILVAYDDYRDDLLLELEKRIYNNIKIEYDRNIRDIFDFVPGEYRSTGHQIKNIDDSVAGDFIKWNNLSGGPDYTDNYFYESANSFTYNYSFMLSPTGKQLPGFWRAVYKQAYDTDRPHTHPWEMLGFSEQPTWWTTVYGSAPYTSDNLILWEDIQNGVIREPGKKLIYKSKFARSNILSHLPVDENGELLSPINSNYAKNFISNLTNTKFKFGDQAPVENAWRRSSNYPFALLKSMLLNRPAYTMGIYFDASRIVKNITDEIIYAPTQKRITLKDLVFPNRRTDENYVLTSGLIDYISNYIGMDVLENYTDYQNNLKTLDQQLGFKVKGFTEKEKFKLLLDSRSPLNQSNVFVPDENYDIHLNTSTPIDVLIYSGVIVEKLSSGFLIKGYDQVQPFFKYFAPIALQNDPVKRVGGVSKSFVVWVTNKRYDAGQIVEYQNQYYIADVSHISGTTLDNKKFTKLKTLPIEGGITAVFSRQFDRKISTLNYGTVFRTQQDVVNFLLGYGKYLESQGFVFDNFNKEINTVENWSLSAQEFMFWTTQNWKIGAVLTLSPSANKIELKTNFSVADNIFDNFYDYAVYKADGVKLNKKNLSVVRQGNNFYLTTKNTNAGIYFVKIPLIQKEHVVLIDNVTVFNDVIYDPAPGYRQDRIKVIGYVASSWDGSLNIPGFVYDEVKITEWRTFTDYNASDVVRYKQFYYSANDKITGTKTFDFEQWTRLSEKPVSSLKPNFEYKTNQFGDFYDLDTDNFDVEQQKLAQHLIGYQKREYLQNIINDDVAQYKFYQGFLQDKGTKNALEKLFNSLASANKDSIEFYEEWAIRTGQYGAATGFDEVEYVLDEKQFKLNPQPIELTDTEENNATDFIYKIKSDQTYLKSDNYDHNPFPTKYLEENYVKIAGNVDPSDVNFILKTYDDILTIEVNKLKLDQYIWLAFYQQTWEIYKYVKTDFKILSVQEQDDLITVTTDVYSNITVGEIISVNVLAPDSKQLFKVKSVLLDKIICFKNGDLTVETGEDGSTSAYLAKFVSVRLNSIQDVNQKSEEYKGFKIGDTFWIDNDNTDRWVTVKNTPVWSTHQQILNTNPDSTASFGRSISVDDANLTLAVSDVNNAVYIYKRSSSNSQYTLAQVIDPPQNIWTGTGDFGQSIAISSDGKYLVAGAPTASEVKTYYKGAFVPTKINPQNKMAYDVGDIVKHNEQLWKVINPILGQDNAVNFSTFNSSAFLYDFYDSSNYAFNFSQPVAVKTIIRGDYAFPLSNTTHILIRAGFEQYQGTAVGDKLQLVWNNYTTGTFAPSTTLPYGLINEVYPFDGLATGVALDGSTAAVIDKAFIDGEHVIQDKVDEILNVNFLLNLPAVGSIVSTAAAEGEISYINNQSTQALIYLKNVRGKFENFGTLKQGATPIGEFERAIQEDYSTLGGWWKINLGFTLTSPALYDDKKRTLVVKDIIKAAESRTALNYFNILNTWADQIAVSDTPVSQIAILSYYRQNNPPSGGPITTPAFELDNRYVIRAPKALTDVKSANDTVSFWVNTIPFGAVPAVYDPAVISSQISFDKINQQHTDLSSVSLNTSVIKDKWNGYIEVLVNQPIPATSPAQFYTPQVGDIIQDTLTTAQAEVAYVKTVGLNTLQIYIKNKTGNFLSGSLNIRLINSPSFGIPFPITSLVIGNIIKSELENSVTGSLLVFESDEDIVPKTSFTNIKYTGGSGTGAILNIDKILSINVDSVTLTGSFGTYTAIFTFDQRAHAPFDAGASIKISGSSLVGYNGIHVVTGSTTTSVTVTLDATATPTPTVGNQSISAAVTGISYQITLSNKGNNYNVGDIITILGEDLGEQTPTNNVQIIVSSTQEIFNFVSQNSIVGIDSTTGIGKNARFDVVRTGSTYAVTVSSDTSVLNNAGTNYSVGDVITIYGDKLGGISPANDLTFTVSSVNSAGAITDLGAIIGLGEVSNTGGIGAFTRNFMSGMEYQYVNGLEYWFWDESSQSGISRAASVPSRVNKDYQQVYNIPAGTGYPSTLSEEGAFVVYEKANNGQYVFKNAFIVADREDRAKLGSKIKIRQRLGVTTLYVSTAQIKDPQNSTLIDTGKIYFVKRSTTAQWDLGIDKNYTGIFDPTETYYTDDLVIFDNEVYRSLTNHSPTFISLATTAVTGTGSTATLTFATQPSVPFTVGQTIVVSGITPTGYNGTHVVTACNVTTVSYANTTTAAQTVAGTVSNTGFVETFWEAQASSMDYLGYVPNQSTESLVSIDDDDSASQDLQLFASNFDLDDLGEVLAVSVNYNHPLKNKVLIYRLNGDRYQFAQVVTAPNLADANTEFAVPVAVSSDGRFLAVGNPAYDSNVNDAGSVYVYAQNETFPITLTTTSATGSGDPFSTATLSFAAQSTAPYIVGQSITVSGMTPTGYNGTYIVTACTVDSVSFKNITTAAQSVAGSITASGEFRLQQTLHSPQEKTGEKFGNNLDFDGDTLSVSSLKGDMDLYFSLDANRTYFDIGATTFNSKITNSGSVYVYENFNNTFIYADEFGIDDSSILNLGNSTLTDFGKNILVVDNHVYVSMPDLLDLDGSIKGVVFDFKKPINSKTWAVLRSPVDNVNIEKIKSVFIYNKKTNAILDRLDYIDVLQGKIAGVAEQELYYKTYYDPAVYTVGNSSVSVDSNNSWNQQHVGRLWWDLSTVKFYNPNQNNIIYQTNYWNKLFPGTSVDVYEWVESKYLPVQWNTLSDTKAGTALGISGITKYSNEIYVSKNLYDFISDSFSPRYYFWVKNKKNIPAVESRKLSSFDVAQLIEDPRKQAYRYATLLNSNKFALHNCGSLLEDENTVINFKIYNIDNQDLNIHNEYQLISQGIPYSRPKKEIESVWFNSLIGYDEKFRPVPDTAISMKYRYGTLRRPRQSWFVNRIEALKQLIERTNSVLLKNLIVDNFNIGRLSESENYPSSNSRLYDLIRDTQADLPFIDTSRVRQAVLVPIIQDGKIIDVTIVDSGRGYKIEPTYKIKGSTGEGVDLGFTLNALGQIETVTVNRQGKNYSVNTSIEVRKFSALVLSDTSVNNKWSIYNWNTEESQWDRVISQSYDVKKFWSYVDWYADGYNQFTEINHTVSDSYKLQLLDDSIGDIVKIENIGSGGWLLLEKENNQPDVDYTVNYKTVGRQNGTIQLSNALYDFVNSTVGYNNAGFDMNLYDSQPVTETRIILETLRDHIFVDELEVEYNELFFASLRYVFSEQLFVDWAFKSSFVKAQHNVGELSQKVVFRNDNLENYQDYIDEAKPYKTKVREYVSAYESLDTSQTSVSDFDLPATYDAQKDSIVTSVAQIINDQIINSNLTSTYPNKHWLDNVGFKITSIEIAEPGTGYLGVPIVTFVGGGGTGAKAEAFVSNGKVTKIKMISKGSNYLSAPTVVIQGTQSSQGIPAKAVAILGDSLVKSAHIRVKFDRTTGALLITNLTRTETFTGSGSKFKFDLKWPINLKSNKIKVIVNQRTALFSDYVYNNQKDSSKSYVNSKGYVQFNDPPVVGSSISIQYEIDANVLQTQDRVNHLYEPTVGMLGNDLAQLIEGIDYGGVEVRSLSFGGGTGWNSEPYLSLPYDTYDNTYEDEVFRLDGSTNTFNLSQALSAGSIYNIYKNGVRIDDPNYGTAQPVTNPNALMKTIQGDGSTTVIQIDEQLIPTVANDLIVIRKSTSDGSFLPDPDAYDTLLQGGNLAYTTATGILSQDIIVDGDGFVTPTTSKGPEELVPGQVLDTVDIQVYDRSGETGSRINSYNYLGDSSTAVFAIDSLPQSQEGVFVKVNNQILDNSAFTTNFVNKTVVLNSAPASNSQINIVTMSINGEKIVDTDVFTGDGSTFIFVTRAKFNINQSSFVKVNGQTATYVLEETDSGYQYTNKTLIRFAVPPAVGSVITYVIYNSVSKTFSEVTYDEFTGDGSTIVYDLSQTPFNQEPLTHNVIVKVGNNILNAGYNERFNVTAVREYAFKSWQQPFGSVLRTDVRAFLNGVELNSVEYRWESSNSSVVLEAGIGTEGDILKVYVISDGDYVIGGSGGYTLTLDTAPTLGQTIKVWQFTNHDVLQIERTNYDIIARDTLVVDSNNYFEYQNLTNGIVRLRQSAVDAQYVWVAINGTVLSPSVDYKVSNDQQTLKIKSTIQANDVIDIIHFTAPKYVSKFGFRQFKDMLNRTHYKRLGNDNKYYLTQTLYWYSQEIFLSDTVGLTEPNVSLGRPGVLFIDGERIEYFLLFADRVGQLRRGTLGTGVKNNYESGTEVFDQSAFQTVPYKDETITEIFTSDGSTENITLSWEPQSVNEFEVFVAGRRLRKNSIRSYNATLGMDSPEADVILPAEFSVSGTSTICTLLVAPSVNTKIIVVRRIGKLWNPDTALSQAENDIARFLRAKEVSLPQ